MAKVKCPCGEVLSNVSDGNKISYTCYDDHEEEVLNIWVCPCGDWVAFEINDADGKIKRKWAWYKKKEDKDTN